MAWNHASPASRFNLPAVAAGHLEVRAVYGIAGTGWVEPARLPLEWSLDPVVPLPMSARFPLFPRCLYRTCA